MQQRPWSTHATFAADSAIVMPERALVNYIARVLLLFAIFIMAQLPKKIAVR